MSTSKIKESPLSENSNSLPYPVVDNFQSPINLWNLAIPPDIDGELVRSAAFFGDSDCFKEVTKRIPSFAFLDPTTKKSVRDRRRYLLTTKKLNPRRFGDLCLYYGIPINVSRDLSAEFSDEKKSKNIVDQQRSPAMEMAMTMYKHKGKQWICKYNIQ